MKKLNKILVLEIIALGIIIFNNSIQAIFLISQAPLYLVALITSIIGAGIYSLGITKTTI